MIMLLACTGGALAAEQLQDPTRPSVLTDAGNARTATPLATDFVLNALWIAPTERSALINNRRVTVGDSIGTARVLDIRRDGVVLLRGNEQLTLRVLPMKVKQAHRAAAK
jgi:hypothetical protein